MASTTHQEAEYKRLRKAVKAFEANLGRKPTRDDLMAADKTTLATYKAYARLKKARAAKL